MNATTDIKLGSMSSAARKAVNRKFEKALMRDTLIVFSSSLLIAAAVITAVFYVLDYVIH